MAESDKIYDPSIINTFVEETEEILGDLSNALMQLENMPNHIELINKVFRYAHGIKGSSAMFGFTKITELTHKLENVFDKVRNGDLLINTAIMNIIFAAVDKTKQLLTEVKTCEDLGVSIQDNLTRLEDIIQGNVKDVKYGHSNYSEGNIEFINTDIFQLKNMPPPYAIKVKDAFKQGFKFYELLITSHNQAQETISKIGSISCDVGEIITGFPFPKTLPCQKEPQYNIYQQFNILLLSSRLSQEDIERYVHILFEKEETELNINIKEIFLEDINKLGNEPKMLGEYLVEGGVLNESDIEAALAKQKRLGEILIAEGKVKKRDIDIALAKQQVVKKTDDTSRSIRIDMERLDRLMNLIGEQSIISNNMEKVRRRLAGKKIPGISRELNDFFNNSITSANIMKDMQKMMVTIRMVPLNTIFQKMNRIVRDISKNQNKEIKLKITGEEVLVDKAIIDKLNDPMVHLIRNAADHGIEVKEIRENVGKPASGIIYIRGIKKKNKVIIEVEDDGKGIPLQMVKKAAVRKGIMSSEEAEQLSEKEIVKLIFLPGFSTAKYVTDISGRGVGMDIVNTIIKELNGEIDVQTIPGKGTKTTLILPINSGILEKMLIKALIISVEDTSFAIPVSSVKETINIRSADIESVNNIEVISHRGDVIALIQLGDLLNINPLLPIEGFSEEGILRDRDKEDGKCNIVIISHDNEQRGIVVDHIVGYREIVNKPLDSYLKNIICNFISGTTFLEQGEIGMVLDVKALINLQKKVDV